MENKILASRMVLAVAEKVHSQLEDLRVRVQFLEGTEELDGGDLFRPEVLVHLMIEQWAKVGMSGDSWPMVSDVVQKLLIERLKAAYADANDVMIKKGVMPMIELKDRVKAPARRPASARPHPAPTRSSLQLISRAERTLGPVAMAIRSRSRGVIRLSSRKAVTWARARIRLRGRFLTKTRVVVAIPQRPAQQANKLPDPRGAFLVGVLDGVTVRAQSLQVPETAWARHRGLHPQAPRLFGSKALVVKAARGRRMAQSTKPA